jgi:MraZ protein
MDYFERKLDDKRRLTIPTELRNEFASGIVITRGFGNYLHMYPKSVWDQLVEPELQGSILDETVADLNVRFRMGKVESELDQKQGRVSIEQHLLDFASISKDLTAVRAGKYWRLVAK